MNAAQVIPFQFEAKQVRAFCDEAGEPWFCAADVCKALGYANSRKAIADNCREKGVTSSYTLTSKGRQALTFINEGNLYRLIIKSRKEEAQRFESWVCDEVLPAIRKHGRYEDSASQMGGLVFEAIGVSELTAIKGVIQDKAKAVPKPKRRSFIQTMHQRLHTRFNVQRTELIPHKDFADACNFVAAYVLEGEWLEKEQESSDQGVISLSAYEAQHVYLLMSRLAVIGKHSSSLGEAGRALGSEPMKSVYSQLLESRVSFGFLDKAIGSRLYQAYRSLGLDGGYRSARAMTA